MFATEAREYIQSLIRIQNSIKEKGYMRSDQLVVNECIQRIKPMLKEYHYYTNDKMSRFWNNHREEIRYLVPTSNHTSFKALLVHFECLDRDAKAHQTERQLINS